MPIGKGYPHCNGIKWLKVDELINFKDKYSRGGETIRGEQIQSIPLDVCFSVWTNRDFSSSEPDESLCIYARVIVTARGPQLNLWYTTTGGVCDEPSSCHSLGDPDITRDLDANSPSGTVPLNHQIPSGDEYAEEYEITDATLTAVSYDGLVYQETDGCGYAQFKPHSCGHSWCYERRFEFMATCSKMPNHGNMRGEENQLWRNWWRSSQCEGSNVYGLRHLSEKNCLAMGDPSEAPEKVLEAEGPIRLESGRLEYRVGGLMKCVPAPEGGVPVRPTPNYRWESSDPTIGCTSDSTLVTHHFMTIFEGTTKSETQDDAQNLLSFVKEMGEDEKLFFLKKLGLGLYLDDNYCEGIFGGWLTTGDQQWCDDYVDPICVALDQVINRAKGGILVKWSISAETVRMINEKQMLMSQKTGQEQVVRTGFGSNTTTPGVHNPFKVEQFYYQQTSQILIGDNKDCGLQARYYKEYAAVYQADAPKLLKAVNEMPVDQCEFWMRTIMRVEFGKLSGSSEVCVGCIEAVIGGNGGNVDVKYWLSSSSADEVEKAQVKIVEILETGNTLPTSTPELEGKMLIVPFASSSEIGKSKSYTMCGPKAPHRTVLRTRFRDFMPGNTSNVVDYWDQKCEPWLSQVMEVPPGWNEVEKVCTGCNKVTKRSGDLVSSALVEWWISGDDPTAIGAFRTKTEQRLLKKDYFEVGTAGTEYTGGNRYTFKLDLFDEPEEYKGILGLGRAGDIGIFGTIGCYLCCSIVAGIIIFLCNRTSSNPPPNVQVNRDGNRRQSIAKGYEEDQTDIGALEGVSKQEIQEEQAISGRVDAEELV